MRNPLKRHYGQGDLHFVTFSCYRRRPLLGTARARDQFVKILDEVRRRHGFRVVGYVVMPEHVHLLLSEPIKKNPSKILQVLKQKVARVLLKRRSRTASTQLSLPFDGGQLEGAHFWQRRFYDFNGGARKS
jgi:putative transposase